VVLLVLLDQHFLDLLMVQQVQLVHSDPSLLDLHSHQARHDYQQVLVLLQDLESQLVLRLHWPRVVLLNLVTLVILRVLVIP